MGIRAVTGYLAHFLLAGYWVWVISSTTPQLRRSSRCRALAVRLALIKTAGIVVTALTVGVIHFWATQVWHVVATLVIAVAIAIPLRRRYRALVAAPRHRLTLGTRAREFEHRHGFPHRPAPDPRLNPEDAWNPARMPHPHGGRTGR
jgi:hypothetical protein